MDLTADEWTEHYDNSAWVREHRDDLRELGFNPPTSLARIPDWLDSYKGKVTHKLKGEDAETDSEDS